MKTSLHFFPQILLTHRDLHPASQCQVLVLHVEMSLLSMVVFPLLLAH